MPARTVDQKIAASELRTDHKLDQMEARITGVVRAEVAKVGLNGEREAIFQLAAATPALLRLVPVVEDVIASTYEDRKNREWWEGLRTRLHWNKWVGPAFKSLLAAGTGALAFQEGFRIFTHQSLWP